MVVAFAAALGGCGAKENVAIDTAPAGADVRVYEVFGMDCPGCHGGLEKLVNAVPGVVASQASWEDKQLTVRVADNVDVDDAAIGTAIKKANFTPGRRLQ